MMEIERENMIKIGTKVEFNYGAMHPVEYGVVTKIENNIATIKGDVGFVEEINLVRINEKSVNGSPIGVWTI
jgi:hypothetical protein